MLEVCFEDDYIIAVNKPNNVLVHHSAMARNQSDEKSLVQLLFNEYQLPFYPIHRLDRKTSGIILCAKHKEHVTAFQELFITNQIQKRYWGLVRGYIAKSGKIDTPVKGRDANTHKDALTYFKCLKTAELNIPVHPYENARYSLVELTPKTGRLHQLRIHLNKISHPLIGDPKYGDRFHNRMFISEFKCEDLFLDAKEIHFKHPYTLENHSITAKLPCHWHEAYLYLNFT